MLWEPHVGLYVTSWINCTACKPKCAHFLPVYSFLLEQFQLKTKVRSEPVLHLTHILIRVCLEGNIQPQEERAVEAQSSRWKRLLMGIRGAIILCSILTIYVSFSREENPALKFTTSPSLRVFRVLSLHPQY